MCRSIPARTMTPFYAEFVDWLERMREDWDRRAREDAERFIYTRDQATDVADFDASGEANYKQLVRPYLPILLNGASPSDCTVVEIGCGAGRMTQWFARDFGRVEALDVSAEMIVLARKRLAGFPNVSLHIGSGADLAPVAEGSADLVFSYIVFQHIPSREVIENYVREAARVLKPGGAFKFQLNGDRSPQAQARQRDTWYGETFSPDEALAMLRGAGFSLLASEGAGTQYYVLTARKGPPCEQRTYVLAGEPWAEGHLLEGFGPPVGGSWRPLYARARVRLEPTGSRLYLGLYFWPESCVHRLTLAGHVFEVSSPGDHFLECPAGSEAENEITLEPEPARPPAFRVIGRY